MWQKLGVRILLVGLVVAGACSRTVAQNSAPGSLQTQLEAQYKRVKTEFQAGTLTTSEPGAVLVVQKQGIFASSSKSGAPCSQIYDAQDSNLHPPDTPCKKSSDSRILQNGDRVYPSKISVDLKKATVSLTVLQCDSCAKKNEALSYRAELIFQYPPDYLGKAETSQITDVIAQVLALDQGGQLDKARKSQEQPERPLSNEDIIDLVNKKVPPKAIISLIQTAPETDFDVSKKGLIGLAQARVPEEIMEAMQGIVAGAAAPATAADPTPSSSPQQEPYALLISKADQKLLNESEVSIEPTKAKSEELRSMAEKDDAVNSTLGGVICDHLPSWSTSYKWHCSVTYLWALPGKKSDVVLATDVPTFEVTFDNVAGADPKDFQPVLVKLEPTAKNRRLLGASKGPENVLDSDSQWELYSSFKEELVPSHLLGPVKPGVVRLQCDSKLAPGEYALVLRPVSRNKKVVGSEIKNHTGDGLMLARAWDFSIQ